MPRVPHSGMEIIRRLATEANVGYSLRAFERSDERDIDLLDALAVLRQGEIEGEIVAGNSLGEWKCKVTGIPWGHRAQLAWSWWWCGSNVYSL